MTRNVCMILLPMPASTLEAIEVSAWLWPIAFGHAHVRRPLPERLKALEHLQAIRERFHLPTQWRQPNGGPFRSMILIEAERVREALRLQPDE